MFSAQETLETGDDSIVLRQAAQRSAAHDGMTAALFLRQFVAQALATNDLEHLLESADVPQNSDVLTRFPCDVVSFAPPAYA
jgi:hypothetical protein